MITKDIVILKSEVMPDVYKITGYTSKLSEQENQPDKTSATEDEKTLLSLYFVSALSAVCDFSLLYSYISKKDDEGCTIHMNLPANYDEDCLILLEEAIRDFCVNFILQHWFNISKKNELEFYTAKCQSLKSDITGLLSKRTKPTRT